MNWPASISLLGLGFVIGFASSDWRVEPEASMTLPQGTCKPDRVQVVHMDGARQVTVMVQKGVDCITILEGAR